MWIALLSLLDELIAKKRDLMDRVRCKRLAHWGETYFAGFTDPWQEKHLRDHVLLPSHGTHSRAQSPWATRFAICTTRYPCRHHRSGLDVAGHFLMPRLSAAAARSPDPSRRW